MIRGSGPKQPSKTVWSTVLRFPLATDRVHPAKKSRILLRVHGCPAVCRQTAAQGTIQIKQRLTTRTLDLASERGASNWLTSLPISEFGFSLHKGAFVDALCLCYGWLDAWRYANTLRPTSRSSTSSVEDFHRSATMKSWISLPTYSQKSVMMSRWNLCSQNRQYIGLSPWRDRMPREDIPGCPGVQPTKTLALQYKKHENEKKELMSNEFEMSNTQPSLNLHSNSHRGGMAKQSATFYKSSWKMGAYILLNPVLATCLSLYWDLQYNVSVGSPRQLIWSAASTPSYLQENWIKDITRSMFGASISD